MKPIQRTLFLFLAASIVFTSHRVAAGVGSDLESFFTDMNYQNVTRPGAYEGQRAGYFTGGGVYARMPVCGFDLLGVQTPRFRAGCGGIDVYTGGFSFINADEFVEFLRTVGQNAKGLAFMLAMKVVSPQIEQTIAWLQEKAQMLNQFQMDSCEAAGQALGGALELFGATEQACIARRVGELGEDYGSARVKCRNNPNDRPARAPDEDDINFHEGNLAWQAMMKNEFFRNDLEIAQLVMNLTGTVIVTRTSDADPQTSIRVIPSQLTASGPRDPLIQALMEGGAVEIFTCADADVDAMKCVEVSALPGTINVTSGQALREAVATMLGSISEKIQTETSGLTPRELGLIRGTTLPVYKYLTVASAYFAGSLSSEVTLFSDLIAKDIVHAYLLDLLRSISSGAVGLQETQGEAVKEFLGEIREARKALSESQRQVNQDYDTALNFLVRSRDYERALVGRLSPTILQSAAWSSAN